MAEVLGVEDGAVSFHTEFAIRRAAEWLHPDKCWAPSALRFAIRRIIERGDSGMRRITPGAGGILRTLARVWRVDTLICVDPRVVEAEP